jgi:hypothetical protein
VAQDCLQLGLVRFRFGLDLASAGLDALNGLGLGVLGGSLAGRGMPPIPTQELKGPSTMTQPAPHSARELSDHWLSLREVSKSPRPPRNTLKAAQNRLLLFGAGGGRTGLTTADFRRDSEVLGPRGSVAHLIAAQKWRKQLKLLGSGTSVAGEFSVR